MVEREKGGEEMKVCVLTVEDVKISKWRWWSKWIDIAVFDFECRPWLIQMKISRTNGKKFRSISIVGSFYKQATTREIGDLTPMLKGE
jgi:hypothetical protein